MAEPIRANTTALYEKQKLLRSAVKPPGASAAGSKSDLLSKYSSIESHDVGALIKRIAEKLSGTKADGLTLKLSTSAADSAVPNDAEEARADEKVATVTQKAERKSHAKVSDVEVTITRKATKHDDQVPVVVIDDDTQDDDPEVIDENGGDGADNTDDDVPTDETDNTGGDATSVDGGDDDVDGESGVIDDSTDGQFLDENGNGIDDSTEPADDAQGGQEIIDTDDESTPVDDGSENTDDPTIDGDTALVDEAGNGGEDPTETVDENDPSGDVIEPELIPTGESDEHTTPSGDETTPGDDVTDGDPSTEGDDVTTEGDDVTTEGVDPPTDPTGELTGPNQSGGTSDVTDPETTPDDEGQGTTPADENGTGNDSSPYDDGTALGGQINLVA